MLSCALFPVGLWSSFLQAFMFPPCFISKKFSYSEVLIRHLNLEFGFFLVLCSFCTLLRSRLNETMRDHGLPKEIVLSAHFTAGQNPGVFPPPEIVSSPHRWGPHSRLVPLYSSYFLFYNVSFKKTSWERKWNLIWLNFVNKDVTNKTFFPVYK